MNEHRPPLKRRLLSAVLTVALVFSLIPSSVFPAYAAKSDYTYKPVPMKDGVLPAVFMKDSNLLDSGHMKKGAFNHEDWFGLRYTDNPYVNVYETYYYYLNSELSDLHNKGQLKLSYSLSMKNSHHSGFTTHWDKRLKYPITELANQWDTSTKIYHSGKGKEDSDTHSYGSTTSFKSIGSSLRLRFWYSGDCSADHAEVKVDNMVIYAGDDKAPTLQSVTATAASGEPARYLKKDDTVYINLNFSENIRFSDNNEKDHSGVKLRLLVGDRAKANDQDMTAQYAALHQVEGDTVTFKYTVPAQIGGKDTNHYISGIAASDQQKPLIGAATDFDLKLAANQSAGSYKSFSLGSLKTTDVHTKTSSLITDLAGNPIQSFSEKKCDNVVLDNVLPTVKNLIVTGTMVDEKSTGSLDDPEVDRSAVFAGAGDNDVLYYTLWFSEELDVSGRTFTATFNVKDSNGKSITDVGEVGKGTLNSADRYDRTWVKFELPIEAGQEPINKDGEPITVTQVSCTKELRDLAWNRITGDILYTAPVEPDKGIYLDTLAPTVATSMVVKGDNNAYTPGYYTSGANLPKFYIPFTVSDPTDWGAPYVSGVEGLAGTFSWTNGDGVPYPFEYYVSALSDKPADDQWKSGKMGDNYSFTQMPAGNFLHIRLDSSVSYNVQNSKVKFVPVDYAGNTGETEFDLDYVYDSTDPTITAVSSENIYDSTTQKGEIKVTVNLADPSGIPENGLSYQWIKGNGSDEPTDGWIPYNENITDRTSFDVVLSKDGLEPAAEAGGEATYDYSLWIKATDGSANGNTRIQKAGYYTYILSRGLYDLEYSYGQDSTFVLSKIRDDGPATDGSAATTVVLMLKDPRDNATGNNYFVRTITTAHNERDFDLFGWNTNYNESLVTGSNAAAKSFDRWYYQTVTESANGSYTFTDAENATGQHMQVLYNSDPDSVRLLASILSNQYYGDLELTMITGLGRPATGSTFTTNFIGVTHGYDAQSYDGRVYVQSIPAGANIGVYRYDLRKSGYTDGLGSDSRGRITALQEDSGDVTGAYKDGWSIENPSVHSITLSEIEQPEDHAGAWDPDDPDTVLFRNSLDDQVITVDLSNLRKPNWGLLDLDVSSSAKTHIKLTYEGVLKDDSTQTSGYVRYAENQDPSISSDTGVIWEASLAPAAHQTFTIPAGAAQYTGKYNLEVSVQSRAGKVESKSFDIYLDRTSAGPLYLQQVVSDDGKADPDYPDYYELYNTPAYTYGPANGWSEKDSPAQLFIGYQAGKEVDFSFAHNYPLPVTYNGVAYHYRDLKMKIWNGSAGVGVDEAAAKAAAPWLPVSGINTTAPTDFVTSAAGVTGAYQQDSFVVPLIYDENDTFDNIIYYQMALGNGTFSERKSFIVTTSTETAEIELSWDAPTDGTAYKGAVTAYASSATMGSADLPVYYMETNSGNNPQYYEYLSWHEFPAAGLSSAASTTPDDPYSYTSPLPFMVFSGEHYVHAYTRNLYGNVTLLDAPPAIFDFVGPEKHYSSPGDSMFTVGIRDHIGGADWDKLSKFELKFPDDYTTRLKANGLTEISDDGYVTLNVVKNGVWKTTGVALDGIYQVSTAVKREQYNNEDIEYLELQVWFDYLRDYTANISTVDLGDLTLRVTDHLGNRGTMDINSPWVRDGEIYIEAENRFDAAPAIPYSNVTLNFNGNFKVLAPGGRTNPGADTQQGFTSTYPYFPIYNGTDSSGNADVHDITLLDRFGREVKHSFSSNYIFMSNYDSAGTRNLGLDVSLSTQELTTDSVEISVARKDPGPDIHGRNMKMRVTYTDAAGNPLEFTNLTSGLPEETTGFQLDTDKQNNAIKVSVPENGFLDVRILANLSETCWAAYRIPVNNIYKKAPEVNVSWYSEEWGNQPWPEDATETEGKVMATISSKNPVLSIYGDLSHTFVAGETEYTFTFTDDLGNPGSHTVYCPVTTTLPALPDEDTTAPDFIMEVYGLYGTAGGDPVFQRSGSWVHSMYPDPATGNPTPVSNASYSTVSALFADISYTRGYKLTFDIMDDNPTKLIVTDKNKELTGLTYENAADYIATIPCVSLSGTALTILPDADGNLNTGAFDVVILDKGVQHAGDGYTWSPCYNVTTLSFTGNEWAIDLTKPEGTITVDWEGLNQATLYAQLTDNTQSPVELVQPANLSKKAGGPYDGQYMLEVIANGTYTFLFRDAAHNYNTASVDIGSIDADPPLVLLDWWSPALLQDGVAYPSAMPTQKVNKDVTAHLTANKDIASWGLEVYDGDQWTSDDQTVARYAALDYGTRWASVTFLRAAEARVTYIAANGKDGKTDTIDARALQIDKTAPVITSQVTDDLATKTSATAILQSNEDVWDSAGQKYAAWEYISYTYHAQGTYNYVFTDEAGNVGKASVTISHIDTMPPVVTLITPVDPNGDSYIDHYYSFEAVMNEDGTIYFSGDDNTINVTAGREISLTVNKNGVYRITGTDAAGWASHEYLEVGIIDTTKPVITMASSTLRIRQDSPKPEADDVLAGVTVTDDISQVDKIDLTLDATHLAAVDTSIVGVYPVTVTARDQAGNVRTAIRYVRVYSKAEPEIFVAGIKTEGQGTTVISVSGDGPYSLPLAVSLYDKTGAALDEPYTVYLRSGIKTAGQMKNNATKISGDTLTLEKDGFYTLYVITQSRTAYLTKLYLQP